MLLFLFALCKVTGDEDRIAGKTEGYLDQRVKVAAAELMLIRRASATTAGVSKSPARAPALPVIRHHVAVDGGEALSFSALRSWNAALST